jgi:dienelactone hydrolase
MSEQGSAGYSTNVLDYLQRIYDGQRQAYACRASSPKEVEAWQGEARPALRTLIGLEAIQASARGHRATVELGEPEAMDGYTRQLGLLHSEPSVSIPFWYLQPGGAGPHPLGVFPHGHEDRGMDTYVGLYHDEEKRHKIEREERDVAVQAVRQGFIALAPNTRGFAPANVPDITARHGARNCRSQLIHCLLAGRTAIGERVWDLSRLLDWALSLPEVDASRVLMMGNSGGGVATVYTAACDTRVKVAVPSCSFCTLVGQDGVVHHCDCNTVPGILAWGEFCDVAGLIAPRPLLIVNGRQDALFPLAEVDRAVEGVCSIYAAAGVPERFAHRYGEGGHRFYADLMWPFIRKAI